MTITESNTIFRIIQLIPLILVFCPIFQSFWIRRNKINGLRKIRIVLLFLVSSLIISNTYFLVFSYFKISRTIPVAQTIVTIEKIINVVTYWLLFYLFRHAAKRK